MLKKVRKSIQHEFIFLLICSMLMLSIGMLLIMFKNMNHFSSDAYGREMNFACGEAADRIAFDMHDVERSVQYICERTKAVAYFLDSKESEQANVSGESLISIKENREAIKEIIKNDFSVLAADISENVSYYLYFPPEFTHKPDGFFYLEGEANYYSEGSYAELCEKVDNLFQHDVDKLKSAEQTRGVWLSPKYDQQTGTYLVSCMKPVYYGNEFIAVVGMDLDFYQLLDKVAAVQYHESGFAFLVDTDGKVMRDPRKGEVDDTYILSDMIRDFQKKRQTSGTETIPYNYEGVDKAYVYFTLPNGMYLILTAPMAEITKEEKAAALEIIVFTILLGMMFVGITVLYVRKITGPLEQLSAAATQIAKGNLDVNLDMDCDNEVGTLAADLKITVQSLKEHIGTIEVMAYKDGLTHVKNIAAYEEMVDLIEQQMVSSSLRFAIVMVDLNELKRINDQYGHEAGDTMIINSCKAVCNIYRHSPVYRIGGDEFVVFLQGEDYENRDELLRVMMEFTKPRDYQVDEPWYTISLSVGMSEFRPGVDHSYNDVFRRADEKMYQVKHANKVKALENTE